VQRRQGGWRPLQSEPVANASSPQASLAAAPSRWKPRATTPRQRPPMRSAARQPSAAGPIPRVQRGRQELRERRSQERQRRAHSSSRRPTAASVRPRLQSAARASLPPRAPCCCAGPQVCHVSGRRHPLPARLPVRLAGRLCCPPPLRPWWQAAGLLRPPSAGWRADQLVAAAAIGGTRSRRGGALQDRQAAAARRLQPQPERAVAAAAPPSRRHCPQTAVHSRWVRRRRQSGCCRETNPPSRYADRLTEMATT
jgi:hypothetical protein